MEDIVWLENRHFLMDSFAAKRPAKCVAGLGLDKQYSDSLKV